MNATAAQTKSLEWLNRLRANPKIPLIVAGSAAVAVMVALIPVGESSPTTAHYSAIFPIRMVAQLSAN